MYDATHELEYLDMVFSEGLRMYPLLPVLVVCVCVCVCVCWMWVSNYFHSYRLALFVRMI